MVGLTPPPQFCLTAALLSFKCAAIALDVQSLAPWPSVLSCKLSPTVLVLTGVFIGGIYACNLPKYARLRKLEADKRFDDMKQRLTEMQTGIERRLERIETQLDKDRRAYRPGIEGVEIKP